MHPVIVITDSTQCREEQGKVEEHKAMIIETVEEIQRNSMMRVLYAAETVIRTYM